MTKELFTKMILEIHNFNVQVDQWCEVMCANLFESPLVESGWNLISMLINRNFDEEGQDWINWWLYERRVPSDMKAYNEDGSEIPMDTIEDLWNLVEKYRI